MHRPTSMLRRSTLARLGYPDCRRIVDASVGSRKRTFRSRTSPEGPRSGATSTAITVSIGRSLRIVSNGMLLGTPPSTSRSSPIGTGGRIPGMATLARTARRAPPPVHLQLRARQVGRHAVIREPQILDVPAAIAASMLAADPLTLQERPPPATCSRAGARTGVENDVDHLTDRCPPAIRRPRAARRSSIRRRRRSAHRPDECPIHPDVGEPAGAASARAPARRRCHSRGGRGGGGVPADRSRRGRRRRRRAFGATAQCSVDGWRPRDARSPAIREDASGAAAPARAGRRCTAARRWWGRAR